MKALPRHRRASRLRAGGFTLVEVVGAAAVITLALVGLRSLLVIVETRAALARAEANVGRLLRAWQNAVTACPYDLIPAQGPLERGFAQEPWDPASQSYLQQLPFEVSLARNTMDETLPSERSELTVTVTYRTVPTSGQSGNAVQERKRVGSLVVRYPSQVF